MAQIRFIGIATTVRVEDLKRRSLYRLDEDRSIGKTFLYVQKVLSTLTELERLLYGR